MNYKFSIHMQVDFYDFTTTADAHDYSFSDIPRLLDAEHMQDVYNAMMKRFKGYKRLMLTLSGYCTDNNGRLVKTIQEIRYIHDYVGMDYERLEKSYLKDNRFNTWNPSTLKDVKEQIKSIISLVNHAQLTEKVVN